MSREALLPCCLAASYAWDKHIAGWSAPNLSACICNEGSRSEYHAQQLLLLMSFTCIEDGTLPGWCKQRPKGGRSACLQGLRAFSPTAANSLGG